MTAAKPLEDHPLSMEWYLSVGTLWILKGWRQAGCPGWGYADVLPYFKRMETYGGGGDSYRGDKGPLHVHRAKPQDPLTMAFIKAGEEAGYPKTDDISGFCQEGFGVSDRTVFKGERWSTARAYLDPVRTRPKPDN
jgi:choline dehydrogenase